MKRKPVKLQYFRCPAVLSFGGRLIMSGEIYGDATSTPNFLSATLDLIGDFDNPAIILGEQVQVRPLSPTSPKIIKWIADHKITLVKREINFEPDYSSGHTMEFFVYPKEK